MVIALLSADALTISAADKSATTGTIVGAVSSTGTRNALQGAMVSVPALNRQELTDNSGAFVLSGLPVGPVELVISYIGFNDERRTTTVQPGENVRVDAELRPTPAITMDAFTVSTEREGRLVLSCDDELPRLLV